MLQTSLVVTLVGLMAIPALARGDEPPVASGVFQPDGNPPGAPPTALGRSGFPGTLDVDQGFRGSFGALGLPATAIPGRKWVAGGKIIIAHSDDGKQVLAYCERYPRWISQDLLAGSEVEATPVVGGDAAAVMQGQHCYAYSSSLGKWDVLTLPAGEKATPAVGDDDVRVHSESQGDYLFKDAWGKWFSAEDIKAGRVAEYLQAQRGADPGFDESTRVPRTTIFLLEHTQAAEALRILTELYGRDVARAAIDEQRNSLIVVTTDEPVLTNIQKLLEAIDTPTAKNLALPQAPPSARNLRDQYRELEQQTHEQAGRLRTEVQDPAQAESLRAALRELVRKAFVVRQQLQRAELAEFSAELEQIQRSIETRDRLANEIIDRRVEELLDPNLRWEGKPGSGENAP